MCRTDALIDVVSRFSLKTVQRTHAQDIHIAGLGYLVPKLFESNGRIRLPLCPEDRRSLATRGNTRVFSRRAFRPCLSNVYSRSPIRFEVRSDCYRCLPMHVSCRTSFSKSLIKQVSQLRPRLELNSGRGSSSEMIKRTLRPTHQS